MLSNLKYWWYYQLLVVLPVSDYFDTRPKDDPRYLYGREDELHEFASQLLDSKWIAVLGPRRIGKTSIILCGLHTISRDFIPVTIDFRTLSSYKIIPLSAFAETLIEGFERASEERKKLIDILKKVFEGIEEFEVEVSPKGFRLKIKKRPSLKTFPSLLSSIFDNLNLECKKRKVKLVLTFDEAQEIKRVVGVEMPAILAHVYDYCKNISIVFTGSQFGLLKEILDPGPENPLYGRYIHRIPLKKFDDAQSLDFLKLGFRQKNVKVDEAHLNSVINTIDGIPGWLTDFGARLVGHKKFIPSRTDVKRALQETVNNGKRLTLQELNNFLKDREAKERYLEMLKYLAVKEATWTDLKKVIELKFGSVDDKNFTNLLGALSGAGFVEKADEKYKIVDPLLREALRS